MPTANKFGAALALLLLAAPARAQLGDTLKGVLGQSGTTSGGLLGGGVPSVDAASPTNLAGVIQFCVKNNYLGGSGAASIGSTLLGRVGGSSNDRGYRTGSSGLLQSGGGQTFGLGQAGSGGLREQVTHKVCNLVLNRAKSML